MIRDICEEAKVDPNGLVLHSDNGKPMRGNTMIATLQWLGIVPSFSRPHVSDDNPYSEALFRTLKHGPAYPRLPFADIEAARQWVARFVGWYNGQHRHSAIRFVTPDERHFGREDSILARRHALYERARRTKPERWSRTRGVCRQCSLRVEHDVVDGSTVARRERRGDNYLDAHRPSDLSGIYPVHTGKIARGGLVGRAE